MLHTGMVVLSLLVSAALLAQSDTAEPSHPASGSAEPNATSQQPASPQPTKPGDSSHLVITTYKKADYLAEARNRQLQGRVWVHLIIDEVGDVVSVDPVSGDSALLAAAVAAIKQWKFEPYIQNGHAVRVSSKMYYDFAFNDNIRDGAQPLPIAPPINDAASAADAAPGPVTADPSQPVRVHIMQGVSQGLLIHKVAPVYPELARTKRIEGTVVLKALIGKDGIIKDLQVVSSPSDDLSQAATQAVEQWRYRPYTLEGKVVEVDTLIHVNFKLK